MKKDFEIKDLGVLKYFLGIKVDRSNKGSVITQRKYTLDLLKEIGKLHAKPVETPIEQNHGLDHESDLLHSPRAYQKLVGKLTSKL